MRLYKVQLPSNDIRVALAEDGQCQLLATTAISDILHSEHPRQTAESLIDSKATPLSLDSVTILPPLDQQEVWASGVTYIRSKDARERESEGAALFYDMVYTAKRPELFFKAPAYRVVPTGQPVRIRRDGTWNVPEPEITLVINPSLQIVGYTIGNDMSSRDIEGENPLYLPQAKIYDGSCAVGPCVTLADAMPEKRAIDIRLTIERESQTVFEGKTSADALARTFEELVDWLGRETSFPNGAMLMTGTGIVPPDDFTLAVGDLITIEIAGIGKLINPVEQRSE